MINEIFENIFLVQDFSFTFGNPAQQTNPTQAEFDLTIGFALRAITHII
jgi:hypothetical protein